MHRGNDEFFWSYSNCARALNDVYFVPQCSTQRDALIAVTRMIKPKLNVGTLALQKFHIISPLPATGGHSFSVL